MTETHRGGPLQGIRVVELTKVWAGPYVGKALAFLGAEVIRVESEGSLDVTRTYGVDDINNAPGFMAVNPQKLSVQVNMKSEEGIALILDLLRESDVVVENLRPGAIERLGLGYERVCEVNPALVYVSMGMFGSEGPLSYQTGYAPCFAALGGLTSLVGYQGKPPSGMNVRYADSTFGTAAAFAALVALNHRRRSGKGQYIDVSAVESMTSMIGDSIMDFTLTGTIRECDGNRHDDMAPHGVYPAACGGWLALAIADDAQWCVLARVMGVPELARDPRFETPELRHRHADELETHISEWSRGQDAAAGAALLQEAGIAASKSYSSLDLVADPHLWGRGFYREVSDVRGRSRTVVGPAWQMSRAARIEDAAPALGQHNDYVLGDILGLDEAQRRKLAEDGITR